MNDTYLDETYLVALDKVWAAEESRRRYCPDCGLEFQEGRELIRLARSKATDHDHQWVEWLAWNGRGMWNPHDGKSTLFVCDIPDCIEVRTEKIRLAPPR